MNQNASSSPAMYAEVKSQRYPLKLGQIYMFGRQTSTADVCPAHKIHLDDKDVDEKHCCVADSVEDGAFVFDLLSKFGTFLNGERLNPLEKTSIKHGDVMRLGTTRNVKFYNEQMETSHDSSGYGEPNKNNSDIISSSPESTSQRDDRLKRFNSHSNKSHDDADKFLVPAVPAAPNRQVRISADDSFEATMSNRRISLGLNSSNNQSRDSDSFTIPETQHCKPRTSTASNLSIAESDAEEEHTKSGFNLNSFGANGDDDDFCIPETQDIPSSQMPRSLKEGNVINGLKTLEERSMDLRDSDDEDSLNGSQFRICTQDYNEGFGEEDTESMLHSQVIPLIKHTTVLLNRSNEVKTSYKSPEDKVENEENTAQEEDKELININWNPPTKENVEQTNNITSTCSTPDLFEFETMNNAKAGNDNNNDNSNEGNLFEDNAADVLDDAEDYMATQVFPSRNSNNKPNEKDKSTKEKDILSGKDDEQYLTLSDKENLHPDNLEPITDIPPIQLFATREGERSLASTSQRKSGFNQTAPKQSTIPVETAPTSAINIESNIMLQAANDEEDDILTQAFPQPAKPSTTAVVALPKNNGFNSTLLDDKAETKNPASFFAEMERTPKKAETPTHALDVFKMPEIGFSSLKKTSSVASTTSNTTMCSESDMDLLMCTPQLIKDHLEFTKPDDLRKNILAAKNKNLFGDDTDDGEDTEDDRNPRDKCLVQLINVPKDSKDFDKLLPHLKNDDNRVKRKSVLTDEQIAAKVAYKEYKFNISFGHEQEKSQTPSSKSATLSRDERHAARDKEREIEQKRDTRRASVNDDKKQENPVKRNTRRTRHDEATTSAKAKVAAKQKDKDGEHGNTTQEKDKPEAAIQEKEKSSSKQKEDKEAKKKTEKSNKVTKEIADKHQKSKKENEVMAKKASKSLANKKDDANNEVREEKQPKRASKRTISTDKTQESSNKPQKPNNMEIDAPKVRLTRLRSTTEDKEKPTKEKKSTTSSAVSVVTASDELDLMPTQPLRRNTRTRSRSTQKDPNDSCSSTASTTASRASSANRSLNRSSSRLNASNNAFINESTNKVVNTANTSSTTLKPALLERKRKAEVPVPPQPLNEGKRLRRTISQDSTASSKSITTTASRCLISMTMVDPETMQELATNANGLWAVAKDPADSSVLVMDKAYRTFKFLLAIARGIPIVSSKWLHQINNTKSLKNAPINEYLFHDPVFEKRHKFSLAKSLQMAKKNNRIFQGCEFLMTVKILPKPEEIKAIIKYAGGTVLTNGPSAVRHNQQIYLVSSVDDRKEWHKFRRLNKNIIIISTEAIMSSVMRQNCASLLNYVLS